MSEVYYNEYNREAAAMLRQMMADGVIPKGVVDERSITDVGPDELKHFTHCHFFAGIGGWAVALGLAGWPSDRPVWTGSAPCQPFSGAGKGAGKSDERHLFPVWLRLIEQCRPASIYGEQVASAVAHGWLDDVYQGLEAEGYAVGAAVLPACSVGAPHRRDRLWFVAHATGTDGQHPSQAWGRGTGVAGGRDVVAHTRGTEPQRLSGQQGQENLQAGCKGDCSSLVDNTEQSRLEGQPRHGGREAGREEQERPATEAGFWSTAEWHRCADQKHRLIEPSIPLLLDGVQHRRPILHAIGNAIVPQVAAEFIKASM